MPCERRNAREPSHILRSYKSTQQEPEVIREHGGAELEAWRADLLAGGEVQPLDLRYNIIIVLVKPIQLDLTGLCALF